jgi:hypothetical protein
MAQLDLEIAENIKNDQATLVTWNSIKDNPPPQLKVSPIAMVPHKSRPYRAILDLSFSLQLSPCDSIPSVNSEITKLAPKDAVSQLGHSLGRIIHAFATAPDDAKIFMAKWDIKYGFWRLDCEQGEEWNFAYVLLSSAASSSPVLVVPTFLQMGWIESPPYFCSASETAQDVAEQYAELPHGSQPRHKLLPYTTSHTDYQLLPPSTTDAYLAYVMEVYVNDFIALAIPIFQEQLNHVANAMMLGIHDLFPPTAAVADDPILHKKLTNGEGKWANVKEILGMSFDGTDKTIWLSEETRDAIIGTLRTWIRISSRHGGIPFKDFHTIMAKLQHAFITIPAGKGLLSPFYALLAAQPQFIFLHWNKALYNAVVNCRTFLQASVSSPMKCHNLTTGYPDYISIMDASSYGIGGIIIGKNKAVPPNVVRLQWPDCITANVMSDANPSGTLTNSDLKMAGLLTLWVVMEDVCPDLTNSHVALFSDNSPTVTH